MLIEIYLAQLGLWDFISQENGQYYKTYVDASTDGEFKGVTQDGSRYALLNKYAFFLTLIDNLESRLYNQIGFRIHADFSKLLKEMDVLEPVKWSTGVISPWMQGEILLKSLSQGFRADYETVRIPIRDYIDDQGCEPAAIINLETIFYTTSKQCRL